MKTAIINKANGVWRYMGITLDTIMRLLPNGEYLLSVKKKPKQRSINQNSLMWLWFACIEDETGTPKEDIHDYYCNKFLKTHRNVYGDDMVLVKGTSKLTTDEMRNFMENVQADVAIELGINLPTPQDLIFDEFIARYGYAIR